VGGVETLLREALRTASEGPFTASALAERLGVTPGEAEALIGALLAHGYLREVRPQLCEACPLKASCPALRAGSARFYEITERGRALLRAPRSTP